MAFLCLEISQVSIQRKSECLNQKICKERPAFVIARDEDTQKNGTRCVLQTLYDLKLIVMHCMIWIYGGRFLFRPSSRRAVAAGAEERFPEKGRKRGCAAGGRAHRMRPAAARRRRGRDECGTGRRGGCSGTGCGTAVSGIRNRDSFIRNGVTLSRDSVRIFAPWNFPRFRLPASLAACPLTAELSRRRGGRPKGAFRRAGCEDERKTGLRRGGK